MRALPGRCRVPAPPRSPTRRRYRPASVDRGWLALRARLDATTDRRPPPGCRAPAGWAGRWLPLALGLRPCSCCSWRTAWLVSSRPAEYRTLGAPQSAATANALVVFRPDGDRERYPPGASRGRRAHRRRPDRDRRLAAAPSGPGSRLARTTAGRARGRPGRVARRRAGAMRALILAAALCGFAAAAGAPSRRAEPTAPGGDAQQQVLVLLRLPPAHFRADGNYASGYADASGRAARRRIAEALARSPRPRPGHRLADADRRPRLLRDGDSRLAPGRRGRRPAQPGAGRRMGADHEPVPRRWPTTIRCSACSRPRRAGTWPSCMQRPPAAMSGSR